MMMIGKIFYPTNEIAYLSFFMDDKIKQLINQKRIFHGNLQKDAITANAKSIILRDSINWCYLISKRSKAVRQFHKHLHSMKPPKLFNKFKFKLTNSVIWVQE